MSIEMPGLRSSYEGNKEKSEALRSLKAFARGVVLGGALFAAVTGGYLGTKSAMGYFEDEEREARVKTSAKVGDAKTKDIDSSDDDKLREVIRQKFQHSHDQLQALKDVEAKIREKIGDRYPIYAAGDHELELRLAEQNAYDLAKITGRPDEVASPSAYNVYKELERPEKIQVGDIRCLDGLLSTRDLRMIVEKTLPGGWVNTEIDKIYQSQEDRLLHYKGLENSKALATCTRDRGHKNTICFYKVAEKHTINAIISAIGHELAHANDWESDNEMTDKERADLFWAVLQRVTADDPFGSSYVQAINYKDDMHQTLYSRAVEYWAVICEQYFADHTRLNIKDFLLVDRRIHASDSKFNVKEAQELRESIIQGVKNLTTIDVSPNDDHSNK